MVPIMVCTADVMQTDGSAFLIKATEHGCCVVLDTPTRWVRDGATRLYGPVDCLSMDLSIMCEYCNVQKLQDTLSNESHLIQP